jgi:hypothetical protein
MRQDSAMPSVESHNFLELEPCRHQRWYERTLLNTPLGYALPLAGVLSAPFCLAYGHWGLPADANQLLTLSVLAVGIALATITALRIGYARKPLFIGFSLLLLMQMLAFAVRGRFRHTKFALVPGGDLREPSTCPGNARFFLLETPRDPRRFDALVVDMDSPLSDEWVRFIALNNFRKIPVLSSKCLYESLEGGVDPGALNSSDLRTLQPDPLYMLGKRALDTSGLNSIL